MSMSRRDCLTGLALAGAAGWLPLSAWAETQSPDGGSPSLNAVAQTRGMRFGSAIGGSHRGPFADPGVRTLMASQCGVMVPENELKWQAVQSTSAAADFTEGDKLLAFAQANGMAMRGHNLLWHNAKWLPKWVNAYDFGSAPAKAAEALLSEHIFAEIGHYAGNIHSWDVVNETIDEHSGAMRQTVLTEALGDRVIDLAYHTAREAAPDAQLVYNDYMSWGQAGAHRSGVLRLLERLKKDGVPIDALGLQSHISAGEAPDTRAWAAFLNEVTGMGYALLITEFDVDDKRLPSAIPERDQAIADYARAYLDLTMSYRQVGDVLTWGLVDKYSWLQNDPARTDHLAKRPLPYDDHYRATPLRQAIAEAFAAAPARS